LGISYGGYLPRGYCGSAFALLRGATLASLPLLCSRRPAAIAVIKPEQQTDEEERHHEHEKDQCGFQKIIHGKTSFVGTKGYAPTARRDNCKYQRENTRPLVICSQSRQSAIYPDKSHVKICESLLCGRLSGR